ncbi:MAG: hypothetical protein IPM42_07825 [Saprospiraceae bacterium]|nr:hypothetical protein [Saprospiraceae bacterium]
MTYQEKIKYAEEMVLDMKNQISIDELAIQLKSKGLFASDIDKIFLSAKTMLEEEYGSKIKQYMLEGTIQEKMSEFSSLDKSLFDSLKERVKSKILEDTNKKVKQMAIEGKSEEEIVTVNISPCITEQEILKLIDNYKIYTEVPNGSEKNLIVTLGIISIIFGILLLLIGLMTNIKIISRLSLLAIGYGAYNLFKAYSPKGATEAY